MKRWTKVSALVCILAMFLIAGAGREGYYGKLAPGTKYFDFIGIQYQVPESFPEFISWTPVFLGSREVSDDCAVLFFEAMDPEGTINIIVATFAGPDRGRLLAVHVDIMPAGTPPEQWKAYDYIDRGYFESGVPSYKMEEVTKVPDISLFMEEMKIRLNPRILINPTVWSL